jgi:crossover junction endodeoxyribonuclease RuvC
MVVLGIDPGFSYTGYAIIQLHEGKAILCDYGYLALPSKHHLSERIGTFYTFFVEKIAQWTVTDLALETPFLGKNAQNFLKLGYLRGIVYLLATQHKLTLHEFSPREVKVSVTGYGAAEKEQVARMVMKLFPKLTIQKRNDVTDAIAVTLCGIWHSRRNQKST